MQDFRPSPDFDSYNGPAVPALDLDDEGMTTCCGADTRRRSVDLYCMACDKPVEVLG